MNLNCLTCHVLRRTDSDNEQRGRFNDVDNNSQEMSNFSLCWSGNLASNSGYENVMTRRTNNGAHRLQNSGGGGPMEFPSVTPRLQRSPGMRRDWSFEDLCRQMNEG